MAALLQLSNEIAETNGDVGPEALRLAREQGVTDQEIGEVVANLALNVLTNYFNVLADVENDWPSSISDPDAGTDVGEPARRREKSRRRAPTCIPARRGTPIIRDRWRA